MAKKTDSSGSDNGKICAVLSYILVGIIWYFADEKMKKDSFAKFHAKQGLVLLISEIAVYIILSFMFVIGWILMPIFNIIFLVLVILGIINAINGKTKKLPIIGGFADQWFKNL